jgi:SNF2 family DNA or RNA helicase
MKYKCTIGKDGKKYFYNQKTGKRVSSSKAKGKSKTCKKKTPRRTGLYCVKSSNNQKLYFKDGKRISKSSIKSKNLKKIKCKSSKQRKNLKKKGATKPKKRGATKPKKSRKKRKEEGVRKSKKKLITKVGRDNKTYTYDEDGNRVSKKGSSKIKEKGYVCRIGGDNKIYFFKDGKRVKKADIPSNKIEDLVKGCKKSDVINKKRIDQFKVSLGRRKLSDENCMDRSKFELEDYQKKVVEYIGKEGNDGLLVSHATGCGKTLSALAASQCFLDKYNKDGVVIIICPTSVVEHFKRELKKYYGGKDMNRYIITSYNNARINKDQINCQNRFMILDEVQVIKSIGSQTYKAIIDCAVNCKKRLVMTATPFVNSLDDFLPIMNVINGDKYLVGSKYLDPPIYTNVERAKYRYLVDRKLELKENTRFLSLCRKFLKVSYKEKPTCNKFPKVVEEFVPVKMTSEWQDAYNDLIQGDNYMRLKFKKPEAFYNAHRRAVNNIGSDEYFTNKLSTMLDTIRSGKTLIYTNWIDFGLKPIKEFLDEYGISNAKFYGSITVNNREDIIRSFNNDEIQVLIITAAGAEGIDLKGVRNIIVLDPVWNDAKLKQIIGRGARYESHEHLPLEDRLVNVYKMVLTEKNLDDNWMVDESSLSGDVLLYRIIITKEKINENISIMLKEFSI